MLKDNNIDPLLLNENNDNGCNANVNANAIFGNGGIFPNSPNHANNINPSSSNGQAGWNSPTVALVGKTPRSSHKVVTPLRKQNTSFLVASLESLFTDSQGVSEQIAKLTNNNNSCKSSFNSPSSNLANSFASLSTMNSLTDPSLLQSHVQKSLDSSVLGLESSYQNKRNEKLTSITLSSGCTVKNFLYNTPIRYKQSKSHDFSELPSQQRLKKRRSSILAHEEIEDLTTLIGDDSNSALSDLSHFKDNEVGDFEIDVITKPEEMIDDSCEEEYNYFEETFPKRIRHNQQIFNLPSTMEYKDGSKPPYSYASLIAQSILSSSKQKLALNNIYNWIMDTYPYYKLQSCGWQNSIRHNLSLNKCFKKIPRDDDEPGKGAYWTVDFDEMDDFEDGMFKRRRSNTNISGTSTESSSRVNSILDSPSCNNAFLNGTGWSPLLVLNNSTPNNLKIINKIPVNTTSIPMTPLTMSSQIQYKTPQKTITTTGIPITPKVVATNSPYTSLMQPVKQFNISNTQVNSNSSSCDTATFWSYPNLNLSQLGLDAEPPTLSDSFCNIFNCELPQGTNSPKLPEIFQGTGNNEHPDSGVTKENSRMSPLSWILSVSSQDSNLGIFDQSQQILSDYLRGGNNDFAY